MSDYALACDDLKTEILAAFGNTEVVTLPDGNTIEVQAYVKKAEQDGHRIYTFYTDAQLPPMSQVQHLGSSFVLVHNKPTQGRSRSSSQLIREYVMNPEIQAGSKQNEWSEFAN